MNKLELERATFGLERCIASGHDDVVIVEKFPGLKSLSTEEKMLLASELWDELSTSPEAFPPREDHVRLLQDRLAQHQQNPDDVIPWEEVKARLFAPR